MDSDDPLLALVIDAVEVDRQRIATALRGVVAIDRTGSVLPARGYQPLNAQQKILAYLLGRKVAVLLELADQEAIGPKDLAASSGLAEGTVYPTVRKLHGERLVSQDVDSRYYLSPHQVGTAIDALTSASDKESAPDANRGGDEATRPQSGDGDRRQRAAKKGTKKAQRRASKPTASKPDGAPRKRTSSSGFSPTTAVRDLISSGFLDSEKALGDIQRRLKDKQGREVAVTTLSSIFTRLLREGVLDRSKNADGVYEYVRHRGS
jgi:hypothetical protein